MTASKDPNVIGSHYIVDGETCTRVPRLKRHIRGVDEEIAKRLERRANEKVNQVEQNFTELSINDSSNGYVNGVGGGSLSNFYPSVASNGQSSNNSITNGRSLNDREATNYIHQVSNYNGCRVRFQDSSSILYDQLSIRDSISDNGRQIQVAPTAAAQNGGGGTVVTGSLGVSSRYLHQMVQQVCLALDMSFTELNISKIIDRINELKTSQSVSFQAQTWMNERNKLHKKFATLEESISEKNGVIKALNLDVQDLKQIEVQHVNKIELLEAQLKESSMNAAKTILELLECKSSFESIENDMNTKVLQQEKQIQQLETKLDTLEKENAQLSQDLDKCKLSNLELSKENQSLTTKLNSFNQSHLNEKTQLEKKSRHLKKQVTEKEAKLESLTNQIAATKTKCNRKLTTMENEHNSIVDTLAVEIQILRNIINKYFENGHVNNETYLAAVLPPSGLPASMSSLKNPVVSPPKRSKSLSTPKDSNNNNNNPSPQPSSNEDFEPVNSAIPQHLVTSIAQNLNHEDPTSSSTLYLRHLYENRYLHALKESKDMADSNTINNSTVTNLLNIHIHYLTKIIPTNERLGYFKLLIKEYQTRKILKSSDLTLIKKLVETDAGLMSDVHKRLNELDKYVL